MRKYVESYAGLNGTFQLGDIWNMLRLAQKSLTKNGLFEEFLLRTNFYTVYLYFVTTYV
jgi:hypothetical protein